MSGRTETLMYVRHEDVSRWLAAGWHFDGVLPGPHGNYSSCLVWLCSCDCVIPGKGDAQWTTQAQSQTSTNTEQGQ